MIEPNDYAEIENVSKNECFDRWKGVKWTTYKDNPERGTCQSDYDFDEWAADYESRSEGDKE
ncbi:MAG TPA: hypothetical protein V6D33_13480 [Cyanophyceae cyanobacterium]